MIGKTLADTYQESLDVVAAALPMTQQAYYDALVEIDAEGQPVLRQKYLQAKPVTDAGGMTTEVHEYEGPLGKGYILHAWVTKDEVLYHKQQDFGPEGRTNEWEQVNES